MRPHQWMASVDLKDSYFHIGVVPVLHQYLRFHCLGQSFQLGALHFRLCSAPWVFTKTLASLVAWLKVMGAQLYPYLDGILVLGEPPRKIEQLVQTTLEVLTQAGFIVNLKKSDLVPILDLVYIGARFSIYLGRVYLLVN